MIFAENIIDALADNKKIENSAAKTVLFLRVKKEMMPMSLIYRQTT